MKLENCDWVPSHVVHWLSKKLEEKGVPGASYCHTLLSYLHPYFCPHAVCKDPWSKAFLGKELPRLEDFDDSVDSDADFPQENKNITESNAIKKIDGNQLKKKEEYHKRALQCLSSASNKIEELNQLVEELFEKLEEALKEYKHTLNSRKDLSSDPVCLTNQGGVEVDSSGHFLCESDGEVKKSQLAGVSLVNPNEIPRVSADNNNDGRAQGFNPTVSEYQKSDSLQMNCERSLRDDMIGGDPSNSPESFGGGMPMTMREEWEYLYQIGQGKNVTPQQKSGSRLFERDGDTHDPFHHSPGFGLSRLENRTLKEPWEESFNIWNSENTLNANPTSGEPLRPDFGEAIADYDGVSASQVDDLEERSMSDKLQSGIWGLNMDQASSSGDNFQRRPSLDETQNPVGGYGLALGMENNANNKFPDVHEQPFLESNSQYMMDGGQLSAEKYSGQKSLEEELSKSFRQLGIDIWKDRHEFDPVHQLPIESAKSEEYYKMPIEDTGFGGYGLFSKIPRGPVGPYAELNHTETSGFSSVIPQRDTHLMRISKLGRANAFGVSDPFYSKPLEEKENLLTSPRTHFRPIKQDFQMSNDEEKEEAQIASKAQTIFQNTEFLFQRTGSGNLVLDNDMVEGSPKKYMIYKEPPSKFVATESPDVVEASPITHLDSGASGFAPKFKISNNEKFSQTEPSSNMPASPINIPPFCKDIFRCQKNTDSIWESNFKENIKKIWNEEDHNSGKEIWEIGLENMSLKFGNIEQSWSKKDGLGSMEESTLKNFFKKRDREGSDVLSRIKFLWPNSNKDKNASPAEKQNMEDAFLGSSFSNAFSEKNVEGKTGLYGNISWNSEEMKDDPSGSNDALKSKWKPWSLQYNDDLDLAPFGSPSTKPQQFDVSQEAAGSMEDLDVLEPGWDLNDGFEWDSTMVDETVGNEREVFYCEVDGQQVMLPVEYLEDEVYDKYFGPSESKLGGSLPDIPYTETADGKKISFKLKRKGSRSTHSNRPCAFYLEGNCLRTDCKFSHDLSSITCRFWEEDSCFKAETCPFLHGYPTHRKGNRSEGDQNNRDAMILSKLKEATKSSKGRCIGKSSRPLPSSFEIDSEADFPSLGSSFGSRANGLGGIAKTTTNKSMGKKTKFVAVPSNFLQQFDVKVSNAKSSSQRRKKSKQYNVGSLPPSQAGSEKPLRHSKNVLFKPQITSPKPSRHEDGTLSDF